MPQKNFMLFPFVTIVLTLALLSPFFAVVMQSVAPLGDNIAHFYDTVLWGYIANSVLLMLGVGLGAASFGVASAWIIARFEFFGRKFWQYALLFPLAIPPYIAAFVYGSVFEYAGPVQGWLRNVYDVGRGEYYFPPIRSLGGAVFVFSVVLYPYVYVMALTVFRNIEQPLLVVQTVARSKLQAFLRVALPMARPAVIAGVALVWMETLSDFGAVQHFAVDTFTTGIYRAWFDMQDQNLAVRFSLWLTLFVLVVLGLERCMRGKRGYSFLYSNKTRAQRSSLQGKTAFAAVLLCLVPVVFGFVLPVAQLAFWAQDPKLWAVFPYEAVTNTLRLAVLAALVATVLALLLGYGSRYGHRLWQRQLVRLAGIGYAMPGSVAAVGVLVCLGYLVAYDLLHYTVPVMIIALLAAYVFRFYALASHSIGTGYLALTDNYEFLAQLHAKPFVMRIKQIYAPLLAPHVLIGFLLVAVEVVKELPATLIIRPFNYETLATTTYRLVADERMREMAAPALMIVALATLGLYAVARRYFREDKAV